MVVSFVQNVRDKHSTTVEVCAIHAINATSVKSIATVEINPSGHMSIRPKGICILLDPLELESSTKWIYQVVY